jgi:hypothetical protein
MSALPTCVCCVYPPERNLREAERDAHLVVAVLLARLSLALSLLSKRERESESKNAASSTCYVAHLCTESTLERARLGATPLLEEHRRYYVCRTVILCK